MGTKQKSASPPFFSRHTYPSTERFASLLLSQARFKQRCRHSHRSWMQGAISFDGGTQAMAMVGAVVVSAATTNTIEPSQGKELPQRMVEEIWTLQVFKHDQGPETPVVEKKMARCFLCYFSLVEVMQAEGYTASDDMYYASPGSYMVGSLRKIEHDMHVSDMIKENSSGKKAHLHLFKKKGYTPMIYPVPGEHGWTRTSSEDIDPPKFEKHAGRPKKNRKRGAEEAPKATGRARMTTVTCSNCGQQTHTYRTCGKKLRPDLQLRLDSLMGKNRGQDAYAHGESCQEPYMEPNIDRGIGFVIPEADGVHMPRKLPIRGRDAGTSTSTERSGVRGRGRSQERGISIGRSGVRGSGRGQGTGRGRSRSDL